MREMTTILTEPRGSAYVELIRAWLRYANVLVLATRHSLGTEASLLGVLKDLEPFAIGRNEESEWPGTKLVGHTATVYRIKFLPEVAEIMTQRAKGLFDWQQPWLPEDPCLLRPDGSAWLATISHENDAYMNLSRDERADLLSAAPHLALAPVTESRATEDA
jgi:hypothetical protein